MSFNEGISVSRLRRRRRTRGRREIFRCGIRNFNGFEDFISHLTRELKRIAVPIPPKELISSRWLWSVKENIICVSKVSTYDQWRITDDSSCDDNASMTFNSKRLSFETFFVNLTLLLSCAPEVKRFPSAADIDELQTDIPSIIYRYFPTNIKFIDGKSAHALSFSIISSFSITDARATSFTNWILD